MKLSEQIKTDVERYKNIESKKSRRAFIWDYYKYPIIGICAALAIIIMILVNNIGRGNVGMYAVLVNTDSLIVECDATVFDRYVQAGGWDLGKKKTDVNDRYTLGAEMNEAADVETLQVLTALFSISDMDLFAAVKEYFDYFAVEGGFADLSLLIDKDLLDKVESDLYYTENSDGTKALSGIVLHEGSPLHKAGYYHGDVYIGVVSRAENLDAALAFVKGILSDIN